MCAAALLTGVLTSVAGATPAQALTISDVTDYAGYAQTAYSAYQFLFGHQLTLEQATTQIKTAITAAQTKIIAEVDRVQADLLRSCAKSAIIEYADIEQKSTDELQRYAGVASTCVTDGWAQIPHTTDLSAVDQMGAALNLVGPVALAARARAYGTAAGGSAELLKETLVQANQQNLERLKPQCRALRGAEIVDGMQEVTLECTAYNGDVGSGGFGRIGVGAPLPNFDYSAEITKAMVRTSYPVSIAALDGMLEDPVVTPLGAQNSVFDKPASMTLAATRGKAPYTWKVTGLPPGMAANTQGQISGSASQAGTFTARATATDSRGQVNTASFTWTVSDLLWIHPGTSPDRTTPVGTPVNYAPPLAFGGKAPYTWSATGLPAGLTMSAAGQITGTVGRSPYTNAVTLIVDDTGGQRATRTITWTVPVAVPDLYGLSSASASAALQSRGLVARPGGTISTDDSSSNGRVVRQNPAAGTQVTEGTAVGFTLGRYVPNQCGPNPC
jgi:hypothetical protein